MSYGLAFMQKHGAVVLSDRSIPVSVGVSAPLPDPVVRVLEAYHGRPIRQVILDEWDVRSRILRAASVTPGSDLNRPGRGMRIQGPALSIEDVALDTPVANMVNAMLNDAVRSRASDIHLSRVNSTAVVRFRIDGELLQAGRLESDRYAPVSARLKVLAGADPSEALKPQDGRFSARIADDAFDIRFSSIPTIAGESVVLRLFNRSREALTLEKLGLPDAALFEIRTAIHRANGFLLVSGPAGSGKTTTLHACLRALRTQNRRIVTIEDPVEYHLHDIDQIQTNRAAGLSFDSLLRRVLRQDPDVIMIGEIRDNETAVLATRAALTGHLVLSTVHARSGLDVEDRLESLGVTGDVVAAVRPLVVEQRLVRLTCTSCHGRGCSRCRATGYSGRTGIFGLTRSSCEITSMVADGLQKMLSGLTSHAEVQWATAQ